MQQSLYDLAPHNIVIADDLRLRLLLSNDAERVFEIFQADPDIQKSVTWTANLKTVEEVRTKIQSFQDTHQLCYAITEGNNVIGSIRMWKDAGYFGVIHEDEYGYGYFCDPSKRGKGVITNAAKALMSAVGSVIPVKTFAVYIEDSNKASQAVATRLGFEKTDETFREPVLGNIERRYYGAATPIQ